MKQVSSKIQQSIFLLGVFALSLLKAPAAFADVAPYVCIRICPVDPEPSPVFALNYAQIFTYIVLTLVFELPIFYLLGFKSKKLLGLVAVINIISVSALHILNFTLNGQLAYGTNLLIAETLVIIFESLLLVILLEKQITIKKIIIAAIVANIVSALIGGFIVKNVLGGLF